MCLYLWNKSGSEQAEKQHINPPTNPTQLNTAQQLQFTSVLHMIIKAKFWVLLSQFGSSAEKTFYPPTKQGTLRRVLSSFSRNLGSFSDWKGIYIVQLILHFQTVCPGWRSVFPQLFTWKVTEVVVSRELREVQTLVIEMFGHKTVTVRLRYFPVCWKMCHVKVAELQTALSKYWSWCAVWFHWWWLWNNSFISPKITLELYHYLSLKMKVLKWALKPWKWKSEE